MLLRTSSTLIPGSDQFRTSYLFVGQTTFAFTFLEVIVSMRFIPGTSHTFFETANFEICLALSGHMTFHLKDCREEKTWKKFARIVPNA